MIGVLETDIPIYRYLDLETFLLILETKKIRIYRRKTFKNDRYECSLDLRNQFAIQVVGDGVSTEANKFLSDKAEDLNKKSLAHKANKEWPAICWTTEKAENVLMWDTYTSKYGVRIQSSVNRFLKSITPFENYFYHDKIKYISDSPYHSANDLLFIKHRAFRNEREYRFYFNEDCKTFMHSKLFSDNDFVDLPVDPQILIEKVIFSPKLSSLMVKKLIDYIKVKYGIRASKSHIYP